MNICLIGNGLASLALAKNLINKKIKVFVYYENTKKLKFQSILLLIKALKPLLIGIQISIKSSG